MVNHACNLRCTYCYTGAKFHQPLPTEFALHGIRRAVQSVLPGGRIEMGFFGGEPLMEADLVWAASQTARQEAAEQNIELVLFLTTNGMINSPVAWQVMEHAEIQIHISHDGLPEVHDQFRTSADGRGSSTQVLNTFQRLLELGSQPRVSMVVRPDTASRLPEGIAWLREQGIRHVDPTLDLWTTWTESDAAALEVAISRTADLWAMGLPDCSIGWFDERVVKLAGLPVNDTARCQYGDGQVAVAPSGNLYPCERVIGEDDQENATRLPGHVMDFGPFDFQTHKNRYAGCDPCAIKQHCNTFCSCSNYIRTGDIDRPDGLLCLLDRVCHRETARILQEMQTNVVYLKTEKKGDALWSPQTH
ncbi:MAG: radical SAM protein [Planctomycetales bacterium]